MLQGPLAYKVPEAGLGQKQGWASQPRFRVLSLGLPADPRLLGTPAQTRRFFTLKSKGLLRVFSNTTVQKHQFFGAQLSSQSNSHPYMTTGKTIGLTRQTFVGKVISLLFSMPSRLVITFLPRSERLLISWLQSPSAVIWNPPNKVCHCFHCFPICLPLRDGTRCHDLSFLNAEF